MRDHKNHAVCILQFPSDSTGVNECILYVTAKIGFHHQASASSSPGIIYQWRVLLHNRGDSKGYCKFHDKVILWFLMNISDPLPPTLKPCYNVAIQKKKQFNRNLTKLLILFGISKGGGLKRIFFTEGGFDRSCIEFLDWFCRGANELGCKNMRVSFQFHFGKFYKGFEITYLK